MAEVAIPHRDANASAFSAAALGVVMLGTVLDRLAGWEEAGTLAGAALVVYLAREFPRLTRKGRVLLSIMLAVAALMASLIGDPLDAAASGSPRPASTPRSSPPSDSCATPPRPRR